MTRRTAPAAFILVLLAAPGASFAAGHVVPDPDAVDEIATVECTETSDGAIACTVDAEIMGQRDPTFCLAVDDAGAALANSTGATDDGLILFQEVEASQIAALRCRPV